MYLKLRFYLVLFVKLERVNGRAHRSSYQILNREAMALEGLIQDEARDDNRDGRESCSRA